jgi:hypothetical protein
MKVTILMLLALLTVGCSRYEPAPGDKGYDPAKIINPAVPNRNMRYDKSGAHYISPAKPYMTGL